MKVSDQSKNNSNFINNWIVKNYFILAVECQQSISEMTMNVSEQSKNNSNFFNNIDLYKIILF